MFVDAVARGVAAGAVAGLVFGLVVAVAGSPLVGAVEAVGGTEQGYDHEAGHGSVVSLATETVVSTLGGVLWGLLLGAAFGAVYWLAEPALPGGDRAGSAALASAGFLTVSGAPWLVLPPGTEVSAALGSATRIEWYGLMMIAGALAAVLAVAVGRAAAARFGTAGWALGLPAGTVPLAAGVAVAPAVTVSLTATTAWIVAGQLGLWAILATAHARLGRRFDSPVPDPMPEGTPASER